MLLEGKVIIVTGASSGIGAALAQQLAVKGARLALAARSVDKLQAVADACPGSIPIPTDVSDPAACQNLITKAIDAFGKLDILVNNAGVSMLSRFEAIEDLTILDKLMQTNYFGVVHCTHAALPYLKKTQGLIVGISSLAGKTGVPLRTGYSASKHALEGFLDSLRIELMGTGVGVSIISLDFVDTEIRQHSFAKDGKPLGRNPLSHRRMMSAEDCARRIIKAIEKRKREVLMGRGRWLVWGKLLLPQLVDYLTKKSADHE
jgi:short-subunit dehydrogenase